MSINSAIENVLLGVESGYVFDSHYVINELIINHSDEYLTFMSQFKDSKQPTLTGHQMIGHEIKKCDGNIVERMDCQSWSKNIHGKHGGCALWKKKM
jgi:hypothetical protein